MATLRVCDRCGSKEDKKTQVLSTETFDEKMFDLCTKCRGDWFDLKENIRKLYKDYWRK